MELYENLGFNDNPFSTFSAEEEVGFIDEIFLKPLYLKTLKSDLSNGHSRFILGARGVGKTSLIYQLKSHCDSGSIFSVIVDDYEGIKKNKNKSELLVLLIQCIVRDFAILLSKSPQIIRSMEKEDKERLAFIIEYFFRTLSKSEFEKHYNNVTGYKSKNILKNVYNRLFHRPVNIFVSGIIEVVAGAIRSSLGLPDPNSGKFYKAYLPEFNVEEITAKKIDNKLKSDDRALKQILEDLCLVINRAGLGKPVVFFDKIDEYPVLSGNISLISGFVEDFLKDTTLLLNNNFSLVFSLWDAIKEDLNSKGVRFDKIKPVNISWSSKQLSEMLDKRLGYFSGGSKKSIDLLPHNKDRESILSLASGSPRYLFRLLSVVYDQQNNTDSSVTKFDGTVIDQSMKVYCKTFEFYAVFPGKRGTKDDVMTSVNRLLRIGKTQITTKDFVAEFKVSTPSATNYIKAQQEFSLIERIGNQDGKTYLYEVKHPVIRFLIECNISETSA